jgi:hypothetical protein
MVGCNADGSEKFPLLVIRKSLKPHCFKNVKKLPTEYIANKNALMMSTIFLTDHWHQKNTSSFKREKIALIVNNCPAHSVDVWLTAIKLTFSVTEYDQYPGAL